MLVGAEMTAAKGSTTKSDSPRHFLCLKGIISMDLSKGAIFVCLGRCAEISGGGGGRADGAGFARAGGEVPLGGSQQTPTSCSQHYCFIGAGAGRSPNV